MIEVVLLVGAAAEEEVVRVDHLEIDFILAALDSTDCRWWRRQW